MKFYLKNEKGKPIDPRPLEKLRFQQYRDELVDRLEQQQTARSLTQFVEDVLDLLEEIVDEDLHQK